MATGDERCKSCDAAVTGKYCASCGEAVAHEGDLRVRHLTHDFLHEFTHIDNKIWRTVKALLFQPGRLTAEYWAGRRGPWIRPFRIYLIVTALQLLLASNASGPLGLRVWVSHSAKGGENYIVGQRAEAGPQTPVTEELNHRIQSVYLWTRYLSLGFFAAASLLLYRRRQPYLGAHFIFALHYYTFESIVSGLLVRIAPMASPLIPMGIGYVYLFFSLRTVYQQKFPITFVKTIGLYLAVIAGEVLIVAGSVLAVAKLWP